LKVYLGKPAFKEWTTPGAFHTPTSTITPLRQRVIDHMRMRQLTPKTQHHYIHAMRQFTALLGRSSTLPTPKISTATSCVWLIRASHRSR
jgi:phosphodiesterase/alkaline phosphatase D-like protein